MFLERCLLALITVVCLDYHLPPVTTAWRSLTTDGHAASSQTLITCKTAARCVGWRNDHLITCKSLLLSASDAGILGQQDAVCVFACFSSPCLLLCPLCLVDILRDGLSGFDCAVEMKACSISLMSFYITMAVFVRFYVIQLSECDWIRRFVLWHHCVQFLLVSLYLYKLCTPWFLDGLSHPLSSCIRWEVPAQSSPGVSIDALLVFGWAAQGQSVRSHWFCFMVPVSLFVVTLTSQLTRHRWLFLLFTFYVSPQQPVSFYM